MTVDAMKALQEERFSAYRLIVDNYPDGGLVVFDTELGYVVAGGLGIARYGMSKEKLEGRTIWEAPRRGVPGGRTALPRRPAGRVVDVRPDPQRADST